MSRFVEWLRSLRWWFARQAHLRAEVVHLRQQITAERIDHYRQIRDIGERHAEFADRMRQDNADLRQECVRLDREVDELRHALAHAGEGVGRVSAAVRD